MGSDAQVYIFDDISFYRKVVPALDRYVESGATEEWLQSLLQVLYEADWSDLDLQNIRSLGFSFNAVCDYLEANFEYADPTSYRRIDYFDWHPCPSKKCVATGRCPLHQSRDQVAAEDFNHLFEECLVDQCLGRGQFLGRSKRALWYSDLLEAAGFSTEHPLFGALRKLAYRGFIVGYGFSNSDGIHGWLYAAETNELYEYLQNLDLPQFAPSFQAMNSFRRTATYEPPPPYTFQQLRLSFFRTVPGMAVAEGRGVLLGE